MKIMKICIFACNKKRNNNNNVSVHVFDEIYARKVERS